MNLVVCPEPSDWLAPLLETLDGPTRVFAPWAVPHALGRLSPGLARRTLPAGVQTVSIPGFALVEGLERLWTRGKAARAIPTRLLRRRTVGAAAAGLITASTRCVVAPSLAALRLFARARSRGIERRLVFDLPHLRQLHRDLDAAAAHHTPSRFLRNYRAQPASVARQEAERVLASRVLVRGDYVWAALQRDGSTLQQLMPLPMAVLPQRPSRKAPPAGPRVLLAGLATARAGVHEALDAVARLPNATLLVRVGEGCEPDDLLQRRGVEAIGRPQQRALEQVDLVLAPTLCEAYPAELQIAESQGIPVVCTERAAGFSQNAHRVPACDSQALYDAIRRLLV